jgi:isopentenyl-diphosphate Delta-isomerase
LTRIHYLAPSDGLWGEHEIDYIFILKGDLDLDINPNEVKSTHYVSREELKDLFKDSGKILIFIVENGSVKITPWFKLIVENFLFKWWDSLDSLDEMREEDIIHRL